ncbi:flavin-dependent dehydrogenase [Cryobacterium mesophilum]|uniref:NAD(P)/FAD-dependent oxidoreductase n=1 Tax=Terrimesophilobacter mesophilus TaxID=433647 RepID=UPI0017C57567|nr:NAD(P)/FAD-dependent oxidoreductase [Terrimesophilobacter mesophilus]MBB5633173.1 flavin-dependent dehydrogenase [Terrimesophilobacter mesophilus]
MTDVLVVGGGPIGLATAIEARMAGLSVTVVEPRGVPIDKACGEGLMPGALAALERLGIDPPGHVIAGISYQAGDRRVDHAFRHRLGRGVRRTTLHRVLAERAEAVGVELVRGTVDALQQDDDSASARLTDGTTRRAHWLVGADGLHSTVRTEAGLALPVRGTRRFGLRRHFAAAPWNEFVEVHWTPAAELYVTPVGDGEVGVAVLGPQHTDYDEAVRSVPALADRLRDRAITTSTRGAGPFHQRTTARTAGRVILVGDASGYVDAITGEGIRVGLAQARVAIECIAAGNPARYEREWRRVTRNFRMLTSGLVALGDSPLRSAIVPLARSLPGVYGAVVERLAR